MAEDTESMAGSRESMELHDEGYRHYALGGRRAENPHDDRIKFRIWSSGYDEAARAHQSGRDIFFTVGYNDYMDNCFDNPFNKATEPDKHASWEEGNREAGWDD